MSKKCFVIMPFSKTVDKHDEEYWTFFFDIIKLSQFTVLYKASDFMGFHYIGSHQQMINRLKQAIFSPL